MFKKRYIAGIVGGLAMAAVVLAQDARTVAPTTQTPRQELRTQIQSERTEVRTNLQTQREAARAKAEEEREKFSEEAKQKLERLREAGKDEREGIREALKTDRENLRESVKTEREAVRENSKQLREEFREKVKSDRDRARIAAAHALGLKMLNRYRAAIERLGHLTARLESRVEKLKTRGVDVSTVISLIDEAKNMKVAADADLAAMQARYEDLLKGENIGGVADAARVIASELKTKIAAFHDKLKEIARAIRALAPSENEQEGEASDQ